MKTRTKLFAAALLCGASSFTAAAPHVHAAAGGDTSHRHATAPAGLMYTHLLPADGVMAGWHYSESRQSGLQADNAAALAGYMMLPAEMDMRMHMVDLMYAPDARTTVMLMLQHMAMDMTMVPGPAAMMPGGMRGHGTDGIGDSVLAVTRELHARAALQLLGSVGIVLPTGVVDRRNPDGSFVHYGMQPGGGIYAAQPALTASWQYAAWTLGTQATATLHLEDHNDSGFRFGDSVTANAWAGYRLTPALGASVRLSTSHQDDIAGHYSGTHNHGTPADGQANYGGETTLGGVGLDWRQGAFSVAAEYLQPLHENLNGTQLGTDGQLNVQVAVMF